MKDILIHQSFHGYSEGHRLLESSIKLPDEISRLMLRMSDLSGGSIFPGFEEYLTGYPIVSLNLYVFAKTWYAPEMPRPGCVWTHSLIVQFKDFEQIPSLAQLTKFFMRPSPVKTESKTHRFSGSYANPFRIPADTGPIIQDVLDPLLKIQLRALVSALYITPKRNLLVAAPTSTSFENSILKVWSQQWPALRTNFSFCTGALSARGFAGKPFDVQFAPAQLIREITTSALAKQSQEMGLMSKDESGLEEPLTDSVILDAILPFGGPFRKLLWNLAGGNRLGDFKGAAKLTNYILGTSSISLPELIHVIAEQFPDKSSGEVIKSNLFGENKTSFLNFNFTERELLSELSVSEDSAAFEPNLLHLRARAKKLCTDSPNDAKQLVAVLFRGPVNLLGEEILAGLLEAMNPEIARLITRQQPQFLPTLFRAKPELGSSSELWRAAGDHIRELFESLSSSEGLSENLISAICEAIMSSGAETLVRRALEKWGKPAVFGILNYVSNSGNSLSERVVQALTFHDQNIMEWLLESQDRSLFSRMVCAHIVAPYSYKIVNFGSDIWLRTYEELREQRNFQELNFISSLLLALAFQNASPKPVDVIGLCFQHIHQLAWDNKMPDATWIIFDPITPHLMWLHDWDRCERLRRGLIAAFVQYNWPIENLHQCIKNDDLLVRVLRTAKAVPGGANLFSSFN